MSHVIPRECAFAGPVLLLYLSHLYTNPSLNKVAQYTHNTRFIYFVVSILVLQIALEGELRKLYD